MNCKCWCCLTADPIKTCFTADPIKTCFTGYTQETPATSLPFVTACSEGVLLGCANVKERAIVYFTGHFPFGVRVDGRGREREGAHTNKCKAVEKQSKECTTSHQTSLRIL